MDHKEKLKLLKNIVNKHIVEFTSQDSTIRTTENSFILPNTTRLLHMSRNDNTFGKIFNLKSPDQRSSNRSFFHYMSYDLTYKFIKENFVTASALSNFAGLTDDTKEYDHFFSVTKIPFKQSYIDKQKGGLYVFCLTEDNETEKFWKEYVNDHKGLCLEFEFIDKQQFRHLFELRKICYDNGNDFDFYSKMQDEIFSKFKKCLLTKGIAKFGALYKRRDSFEWERETRLLFNWDLYQADLTPKAFFTYTHNSKSYLKIPLDNDLFSLKIKTITIGKNLDPEQNENIKKLATKKGIKWTEEN